MNWFGDLSVRVKILCVAGLGIGSFLVYFLYSYVVAESSIADLVQIEQKDFVLLEAASQNNIALFSARDALVRAMTSADQEALSDAVRLAAQSVQNMEAMVTVDPELEEDVQALTHAFEAYFDAGQEFASAQMAGKLSEDQFYDGLANVSQLRDQFERMQEDFQDARYETFYDHLSGTRESTIQTRFIGLGVVSLAILLLAFITLRVTRSIVRPLSYAVTVAGNIADGDWDRDIEVTSRDETGRLLRAIRQMRDALKSRRDEDQREERKKSRIAELNDRMRGDMSLQQLGNNMLTHLVPALDAQVGAFYVYNSETQKLVLNSSYAMQRRRNIANEFSLGESLVGQCAMEQKQILLERVPEDYVVISSATGSAVPRNIVVTPIVHEDELKGVLEIGAFRDFESDDLAMLEEGVHAVAIAVHTSESRVKLATMLAQTQQQADALVAQKQELSTVNEDLEEQAMELAASESRLQQQQEELRAINEELEAQAQALRASEESLQAQQEELRVTNEELEAQANVLAQQKSDVSQKNKELEILKGDLEEKIRELELSSKYKSEFLSTMSHELRTPLNSILILSNALSQNKKGNLNDKQIEHAQVIHGAGSDLLSLINDILDISKIEEGKMDVIIDDLEMNELADHFRKHFAHIAENSGLYFKVELGENLPPRLFTDRQRMEQIIKNLLSNAMKFTENGGVTLRFDMPTADEMPNRNLLAGQTMRLSVIDTGIGIAEDKQKLIFEAFQQADGTTSRKYGGTGLGLTISRELSRLLGGDIGIASDGAGQGSSFMLFLPIGSADQVYQDDQSPAGAPFGQASLEQTLASVSTQAGAAPEDGFVVREKAVLIIEDDAGFAGVLQELSADYGLEGHVCEDGESGLEYARAYRPSAIILDIGLPGMDGWAVMDSLKADPRTKDIPVHFLSGKDERQKALSLGAIDFLTKPVNTEQMADAFAKIEKAIEKNVRRMLVVEDSEIQHESIRELFDQKGVEITSVHTGAEAISALDTQVFDCMILDLTLPDMTGFELLEILNGNKEYNSVPVIIYTGKELSRDEEAQLRKYADRIILKTERSSERLLNEASLFLHWLETTMPSHSAAAKDAIEHRDDVFEGKSLLLVDDDMRNIYALSAQLEELSFNITIANNGREALDLLDENPDIDIVLMDIMMPEMDGYEAMAKIREQSRFQKLPILALTAKAMKDDRSKCIEAGANDYCSKPIDMSKLTSLMRIWLHK
ncbi:MAG: response regulator [Gammaproteobacteria bacterium]|nr:response regulator [Gammaproteobacteria bacterium]MBQ0775774.1 response regulator [Gammaproteobacteria bacterium]|tara:strand:+ start:52459 stop:56133 length:3675 start_codon:yes stop_codon:yes gene_type:complete